MGGTEIRDFLLSLEQFNRRVFLLLNKFRLFERNGKILLFTADEEASKLMKEAILSLPKKFDIEIILEREEHKEEKRGNISEGLSKRYTFENFVVGEGNRLAYEVALEITEEPGKVYNPLFIYGGVGIGKTHLLQAIGNRCAERGLNVIYKSAIDFSEEMVEHIKNGKIKEFRDKYKNVDVLLIDDIQLLSGKERTQTEFFNIFNFLFMKEKQIVLASDRHPRELKDISERLISRFEGGVVVEIQLDEETKLEIIKRKLQELRIAVQEKIVRLIFEQTSDNVREIEGKIKSLKAGGLRTLRFQKDEEKPIKIIQKYVALHFGVSVEDILGDKRSAKVNKARRIAMYLARKLTDASLIEIARAFNRKDHSTVIHSIRKVEEEIKRDRKLSYILSFLEKQLSLKI